MSLRAVATSFQSVEYQGTWNASTNTPTLTSSVGIKGYYYVVSVAGSTNLNGITNWGVGDWVVFNGTAWQRVEGGADGNFVNLSVSGTASFANGTAATPAINFAGDPDTGLISSTTNAVGIVTGGVEHWLVNASGNLNPVGSKGIGSALAPVAGTVSDSYQLSTSGILTEATTSRTLSSGDNGKIIYCTSGSATTITCAAGLGAGFSVTIIQGGAGKVTVAAGGQTLVSYSSLFSTMGQYAVISLVCPVANTFVAAGNLGV
jgi:hypothetical protein